MIRMNFHLAAFTYLYEWVCYDRFYMDTLAFTKAPQPSSTEACTQLLDVAKHYNVVRGFSTKQEGTERLLPVWEALK